MPRSLIPFASQSIQASTSQRSHCNPARSRKTLHWITMKDFLGLLRLDRQVVPADETSFGLCSPPIETARGRLMIYHGVRNTASGSIHRLGLPLFEEISSIFGPEAPCERGGDVNDVLFPCGQ